MKFTAADLRRMREEREQRIAAIKADSKHENREYLLMENLAPKSKVWFPEKDKPEEVMMRIVDFMVTKENNVAADRPGKFTSMRRFKVHSINRNTFVCPNEYGHDCPLCNYYYAHKNDADAKDTSSPVTKAKARRILLFNALFKTPTGNGKTIITPRVVRCSEFFFMNTFGKKLASEETFAPDKAKEIYGFSDLETGYWMTARFGMAEAVAGAGKKFMQLIDVSLDWKNPSPVDDSLYEYITDLDMLIPNSPSDAEVNRIMGITTGDIVKPPVIEEQADVEEQEHGYHEPDDVDEGVPGEESVEADSDFDFDVN